MTDHRKETQSGKWKQGTFFLEETRSSQRSNALRVRKERKADRLREKRGQTLASPEQSHLEQKCLAALHSFIQPGKPNDRDLSELHRLLSINSDATAKALFQLLEQQDGTLARSLLDQLLPVQPDNIEASLLILHEITLAFATANLPTGQTEMSYYGRAPLQWRDLFFPETGTTTDEQSSSAEDIITTLLQYSHSNICFETIGNIVLYVPDFAVRCIVPRHWPVLAGALHNGASYAVAAILRADTTHYGMDFLKTMHDPFDSQLLETVDGLWIIQALSWREPDCLNVLRNTQSILNGLRLCISSSMDAKHLIPALQALTNLGVSCVEVLQHIQRRVLIEAVPAAVACTSEDQWIPLFVEMLVEGTCSYPWKVEIVWALADFRVSLTESFWSDDLIDPLVDLMKQHETAEAAIAIIDQSLRFKPESMSRRARFEAAGGVDLLEERAAEGLRMAEQLADDLFADEEVHEEVFVSTGPAPSCGRGRGRLIPSWMSHK